DQLESALRNRLEINEKLQMTLPEYGLCARCFRGRQSDRCRLGEQTQCSRAYLTDPYVDGDHRVR
ncbi:hypothetical protein ACFP2H_04995, partial [Mycolicibacterium llatzerense]|uniref:hypothetical protein n=1 Tax=Mycolicibacterium llatzerense TaxID=280871 RepID=UPI0036083505